MDSLIVAAGRALATGDPPGALKLVSLREDAPALALRGIAMSQLGAASWPTPKSPSPRAISPGMRQRWSRREKRSTSTATA